MKRILTHIFVVFINFYILCYFMGILLMLVTALTGPLNNLLGVFATLALVISCILYQTARKKFNFYTFGEEIIGNTDKEGILKQNKVFTITRLPLFLLMFITLAFSGNFLDGLSDGQTYKFGNVVLFSLLSCCFYYGIKNFAINPEMLPVFLIIAGSLMMGYVYKNSPKAQVTGEFMYNVYLVLSVLWLGIGFWYMKKRVVANTTANV